VLPVVAGWRGQTSIEHPFTSSRALRAAIVAPAVLLETRTRFRYAYTKQPEAHRRLNGMPAPTRQIAFSVLRIGVLVALAMLLILGILPAVLAVEAASN
jgi:hypothetical protein